MHKGGAPQPGGRFHRIVKGKAAQQRQRAFSAENACSARGGRGALKAARTAGCPVPQRDRADQKDAQGAFHGGNEPAARPPGAPCPQRGGDNHRPDGGANAPKAVQPAHVLRLIMQRHKVVQRHIRHACGKPHGERAEKQPRHTGRKRKAEKRAAGHQRTDDRYLCNTEPAHDAVGQNAGDHRAGGHGHGEITHQRDLCAEIQLHLRPDASENGIGKPQPDKG